MIALVTAAILLAQAPQPNLTGEGPWMGRYFLDGADRSDAVIFGRFPTLEACRNRGRDKLAEVGAPNRGDVECGRDCEVLTGHVAPGAWKCAETRN